MSIKTPPISPSAPMSPTRLSLLRAAVRGGDAAFQTALRTVTGSGEGAKLAPETYEALLRQILLAMDAVDRPAAHRDSRANSAAVRALEAISVEAAQLELADAPKARPSDALLQGVAAARDLLPEGAIARAILSQALEAPTNGMQVGVRCRAARVVATLGDGDMSAARALLALLPKNRLDLLHAPLEYAPYTHDSSARRASDEAQRAAEAHAAVLLKCVALVLPGTSIAEAIETGLKNAERAWPRPEFHTHFASTFDAVRERLGG